jgi:hypothetical protein
VKTAIDDHTDSIKPVSYAEQTLTDAEKTQARTNIGAIDDTNVVHVNDAQTITGNKNFTGLLQQNGKDVSVVDSYSANGNGYIRYSNGLQIAWSSVSLTGLSENVGSPVSWTITFPMPFLHTFALSINYTGSYSYYLKGGAESFSTTNCSGYAWGKNGVTIHAICIGDWK